MVDIAHLWAKHSQARHAQKLKGYTNSGVALRLWSLVDVSNPHASLLVLFVLPLIVYLLSP